MTPARIVILIVALVAAVGLALLVHGLFAQPKGPPPAALAAAPAPTMTRVLVAKTDLAVGDRLSDQNMSWQGWPTATLNVAYITDGDTTVAKAPVDSAMQKASKTVGDIASGGGPKMRAMIGDVVREPLYAGEPITAKKIVRSGDTSYMAIRLPQGMRAMALPLSLESGAGGFIEPGDRVDVLSTHQDSNKNSNSGGMVTETVLSNALVLAIDQKTDAPKTGAPVSGATITLEVPDVNASVVAKARTQGGLTIALRSYADIGGQTGGPSADDGHSVKIFKGGAPAEVVTAQ